MQKFILMSEYNEAEIMQSFGSISVAWAIIGWNTIDSIKFIIYNLEWLRLLSNLVHYLRVAYRTAESAMEGVG